MEPTTVPLELRGSLGEDASFELLTMFHSAGHAWSDEVLMLTTERFERRLADEIGKLRLDIVTTRVELLKWSFLFWIGQVAAMAGLLAFMLRDVPAR